MADDEGESEAATKDKNICVPTEKDVAATSLNKRNTCSQSNASSCGPRSIVIERSEYGFGFTLRHFIVYPPESIAILARDGRLGYGREAMSNEPIDTIFVKNVRENGPAHVAGLTTGDRIISVNGKNVSGLSYLSVVNLIFKTKGCLHLVVVPQQNDAIQLYFSEAAHHPESNQKPRLYETPSSSHYDNNLSMMSSNTRHYTRSDSSPAYPMAGSSSMANRDRVTSPSRATAGISRFGETCERRAGPSHVYTRTMTDLCPPHTISDTSSCCSNESGPNYAYSGPNMNCAYSFDVEFDRNNYDSMSDSSLKDYSACDDSVMMNRLRKSLEQKQEFMNRLPNSISDPSSKEYGSVSPPHQSSVWTQPSAGIYGKLRPRVGSPPENGTREVPPRTTSSPSNANSAPPPFQIVSIRAKQFENGPVDNKIEFFRSELNRLSVKHNVANVAARKRDFENRAQIEKQLSCPVKETRVTESHEAPVYCSSGNRTIPIGSKKLHCEPPTEFHPLAVKNEDAEKTDFQKGKPVVRQDSYLAACRKPTITNETAAASNEERGIMHDKARKRMLIPAICLNNIHEEMEFRPARPTRLSLPNYDKSEPDCVKFGSKKVTRNDDSREIFRKEDPAFATDDDKTTRRISYLRATTAYSMNVDSENELSDTEPVPVTLQRRTTRKWRAPLFPGDIQRLRRFFEDLAATGGERGILGSRKITETFPDQEQSTIIKEGNVFCKVIQVEGKKASDRSWKPIWLVLKGCVLSLYKEKKESLFTETPATFDKSDLGASCDRLDIRCSVVDVANDYTKRKHVFRLNAPSVGTELLFQAQDANSMSQWVKVLQEQALVPISSTEPVSTNFGTNASPSACNKTLRKLASLRTRSPTGEVSASKSKKPTPNDLQQTSPKTKTWKNKMAKQFRKIQPGSSSPGSSAAVAYPPGATIGIPLEVCPSSTFCDYVPLIVEVCTNIVEAKGLEIIGIYRVPGNTAAVTSLTEAVNRGLDMAALDQDPRWSDVNVISSLLKSFFRKLPDSLLTSELYPSFIKSDTIDDPIQRMITIRKFVHDLPDHNFETLKYLLYHLKKVVGNSSVNKMEARNLAIVFGPTLIRSGDDMFTMVTDMSHQCRIVESLLSHVDWCFGDGDVDDLKSSIPEMNSIPELEPSNSNHTLLLGNIRKVEGCMQSPTTAKDFVSTIIGAANRKMQKTSKHLTSSRKSNTVNTSYAISSGSEDALDSVSSAPNAFNTCKNSDKEDDEKKTTLGDQKTENKVNNERRNIVTSSDQASDIPKDDKNSNEDQVLWTYPKLSAETKERIRKFEEETEAILQRCTNPRRLSSCISEDVEKEKAATKSDFVAKKEIFSKSNEQDIHNSPPPVVVTRRNLPSINARNVTTNNSSKKSTAMNEFIQNNLAEKSTSLESLNRTDRPTSRHSDDGCDLLMSLTSTFDKKLKSLSTDKSLCEDHDEPILKLEPIGHVEIERTSSFRDPSLHRTVEKSKIDTIQKMETNTDKENDQHVNERKEVNEKETVSCTTCGCSVKHSEAIQQNCDHWRRSVLQEMHSQNRLQQNVPRETKLFYSNSVKLRRSESLKEDNNVVKLRRSGSLNKHEPKISKFESLMLTKNAEAIKLRRSDSLTKSEKTESNMKRRQIENAKKNRNDKEGKLKRRNGASKSRNIKRRHTVGGTKDFDKVSWLENQQREMNKENRKERRTSSPDLSSTRVADFLVEVVVRPRSFITADPNFVSRLLNIPLESHV